MLPDDRNISAIGHSPLVLSEILNDDQRLISHWFLQTFIFELR